MQVKSQALPITKQVFASLFASISAMMVKSFHKFELNQVLYFRAFFSIILFVAIAQRQKLHIYGFNKSIFNSLLIRGVLGALGSFLYFQGLKLVLISESMLLNRTSPLWTSLICIMMLKTERFTVKLLMNMILCFLGISLIALNKKQDNSQNIEMLSNSHILGLFLILIASILNAFVNILVKSISDKVDSIVLSLYQSVFNLIFVSIYSLIQESNYIIPNIQDSINLLFMSIVSVIQGVLQIQSMKEGNLSIVTNVSQIQIPFGYLIDFIIFKAQLNLSQLVGNLLMLLSLIPLIWKA